MLPQYCAKIIKNRGQALLITIVLILFVLLILIGTIATLALGEARISELDFKSKRSYFLSESGIEDAVYRFRRGKNVSSSYTLSLYGATTTVTVSDVLGGKQILASGNISALWRALQSVLKYSATSISFFYGVQVGAGGLEMDQSSQIRGTGGTTGNVYSNGPALGANAAQITGDLTVAGASGSIDDLEVLGTARAHAITRSKICGDAYYQTIDSNSLSFVNNPSGPTCSNPLTPGTAFPGSSDPPTQNMPIDLSTIQNWKNDATSGGTITGNCGDNGVVGCNIGDNDTLYLGPKKIVGNLVLTKKQTLIVTGTLYFTGYIDMDSASGATVKCDASFGSNSCIIITDSWVHIKNNSIFQGSGTSGSYIIILTTLSGCNGGTQTSPCTHHNAAMDMHNNATGAIFYAGDSMIFLHNGVNATELTAYKLKLENNAVVTYEQGLANAQFSSGPTGGWSIDSWREVLP